MLRTHTKLNARAVSGRVSEIHVPMRDRVLIPFPSFTVTTDIEVVPGMSGDLVERKAFLWDLMREGLILSDGSWMDFEIKPLPSGNAEVWGPIDNE